MPTISYREVPLVVIVDVTPPTREDVRVEVKAAGRRASVLQLVSGMDAEIQRLVVKYVARELDKPHIRRARRIDVAARIDAAWPS